MYMYLLTSVGLHSYSSESLVSDQRFPISAVKSKDPES